MFAAPALAVVLLAGAVAVEASIAGAAAPVVLKGEVNPLAHFPVGVTLEAMACPSASSCVAVGTETSDAEPIVVLGNPASWGAAHARTITLGAAFSNGGTLQAVSCTSSSACTAVGETEIGRPLVITGNPSTWSAAHAHAIKPPAAAGSYASFTGVSCTGPSMCTAVGTDAHNQPLYVSGNPAAWGTSSLKTVTLGADFGSGGFLSAVTCTSSSACVAIGNDDDQAALSIAGDPATWTASQALAIAPSAGFESTGLAAISCTSSTACVSVGYTYGSSFDPEPVVVIGNPTTWTTSQETPLPLGAAFKSEGQLWGLSCTSATACVAVGGGGVATPIVVQGNPATWTGSSPVGVTHGLGAGAMDHYQAVACASASSCTAVGNNNASPADPFSSTGNPAGWHTAAVRLLPFTSPDFGILAGKVSGLSCPLPTGCIVAGALAGVGLVLDGTEPHWASAHVSEVSAKSGSFYFESLLGVACATPADCLGVGSASGGGPLLIGGNPASWRLHAAHDLPLAKSYGSGGSLASVSCPSAAECVAVGSDNKSELLEVIGTARATGDKASQITVPKSMSGYGVLNSVSCVSTTDCVAVGADFKDQPIVLHGNPRTWKSSVRQLTLGAAFQKIGTLDSVDCVSATSCVAVGTGGDTSNKPFIIFGNPATWSGAKAFAVSVPKAAPSSVGGFSVSGLASRAIFQSVSCLSATDCVAVGNDGNGAPFFVSGNPATWHGHAALRFLRSGAELKATVDEVACSKGVCVAAGRTPTGIYIARI